MNMNLKNIRNKAWDIVLGYSKYNRDTDKHEVDIYDVDSDDLSKLSSLIMQHDDDYAHECLSADNPYFTKNILPALIKMLASPYKEEKENFLNVLVENILKYQHESLSKIIEHELDIYNHDLHDAA